MRALFLTVVAAVILQRLAEMRLSRRHAARLLAEGGVEVGRWQLPLIILLHVGLLAGCAIEPLVLGRVVSPARLPLLVVLGAAQGVRWWTMRALGPRWTARVITLPGRAPVTDGPYRWLRHPNYLAVAAEGLALPLLGGAWITAVAFAFLNTPVLVIRSRTEDRALRHHSQTAHISAVRW